VFGGGSSRRSRKVRTPPGEAERQPTIVVAFEVMGYLVRKRENPPPAGEEVGCSAFHLSKIPSLGTQRQERIQFILGLLEKQKYVFARTYPRATYYEATAEGAAWYNQNAVKAYAPFRSMYQRRSDQL